jgi:hypothetical protein
MIDVSWIGRLLVNISDRVNHLAPSVKCLESQQSAYISHELSSDNSFGICEALHGFGAKASYQLLVVANWPPSFVAR